MCDIIKRILENEDSYAILVQKCSYDELKQIYIAYKSPTTSQAAQEVSFYTEAELREKLLGSSATVISFLKSL